MNKLCPLSGNECKTNECAVWVVEEHWNPRMTDTEGRDLHGSCRRYTKEYCGLTVGKMPK